MNKVDGYDILNAQNVDLDPKNKEVHDAIVTLTKDFDPDAQEQDAELEFQEKEEVSNCEMFNRFANGGDKILLYLGFFFSGLLGCAFPSFNLVFGALIDDMGSQQPGSGKNPMQDNFIFMVIVAVAVLITSAVHISSFMVFSESVTYKFKAEYFRSALSKDAAFYDEQNPNEMASKINKEASALRKGTSEKVGVINMSFVMFFAGFIAAFYLGWLYTLYLLAAIPFIGGIGVLWGISMQSGTVAQMKAYAQSAGYAEQALQSIRIVHTYGNELLEKNNYVRYLDWAKQQKFKSSIFQSFCFALMFGVFYAFYAYSLFMGGYLRWEEIKNDDKLYSGGKVVAIMFCVLFAAMQAGGVGPAMQAMQQGRVATKIALKTIDQVPIVNPDIKGKKVITEAQFKGQIEFKDVCFTYPSRKDNPILKSFTCTFEAGKTTALVGPSGSGKSTIIQMIERFYQNDSGQISVDGHPIEDLDLRSFRRMIGYVGQEPVLFNATIRENMKFAKPDATDGEIKEALESANAWDFIQKIETGLDTIVGGSGGSLSGGQKQRVAIARAFLKKPRILLLDEATSALDKRNEGVVQQAIDSYRQKNPITIIVIAHRLSTIRDADKIVVLVNGRLTEMGSHDQLLAEYPEGTYAQFCQKQASQEQENPQALGSSEKRKEEEGVTAGASPVKDLGEEDKEVKDMLAKADTKDKEYEEQVEEQLKPLKEKSDFMKVMAFNSPKIAIVFAVLAVAIAGLLQPFLGWIWSDLLLSLSIPIEVVQLQLIIDEKDPNSWRDEIREDVTRLSIIMLIMGAVCFVSYLLKSYLFVILGENVTFKVRGILYQSILEKDIGWFDKQENQSSVLTGAMAQETSLINGASSESLGPYTEALFALTGGLVLGFIFCWQQALLTLGMVPFMVLGNYIGMEFEKGLDGASSEKEKDANLLIGDAINNFKTVQSFAHEELIVARYREFVKSVYTNGIGKHIKSGISYGFSQFIVFMIFGLLFYIGGWIVEASCGDEVETIDLPGGTSFEQPVCTVNPKDVFISLFAIFFGAQHAGMAFSMGPDIAKAQVAATKIFNIIEYPSKINAIQMDNEKTIKRLNKDQVKGKIEFRDVWFRYPTRKNEFVLRGLSMVINPNESVALVGESGCGKSTFVNLLMRFYDPDFGEILLDDVNIREYNLHDLRKAISLVMQEPSIFNYSIKDNILYGKLDAKNSEIINVATIANCTEFIEKGQLEDQFDDSPENLLKQLEKNKETFVSAVGEPTYTEYKTKLEKLIEQGKQKGDFKPQVGDIDTRQARGIQSWNDATLSEGYEIQCGIKGGKLSGGQKQRVAIARTLISQPKVLLLDEATSALDENSQAKVQAAIEQAMQNRTSIIIAHRMTTIEKCSKIFLLEEGRVKEEGQFQDLVNSGGAFSKLAQTKQS